MIKTLYDIKILLTFIIITIISYFTSNYITQQRIESVKQEKFNIYSKNIKDEIKSLIQNKKETTLSIALALAENSYIINGLINKDISHLQLKKFSKKLSQNTALKNVWFQIIDKEGRSFYRSWIKKRGDIVTNARLDVVQMLKKPQIMSTISVGKFDMTFKSMVPIFNNNQFLGMIEIITHFNSIVSKLEKNNNIDTLIIVDKHYKKQIIKPMTKLFIDDYYIANIKANKFLINFVKNHNINNFLHIKKPYLIIKPINRFLVSYNIADISGKPMATILAFKRLDLFDMGDVKYIKSSMSFYLIIIILFLAMIGYYLVTSKHTKELDKKVRQRTKELEDEKQYIQKIFDINPSIIIISQNSIIKDVNKKFLEVFKYNNLDEFKKEHTCICDFFLKIDGIKFSKNHKIHNKQWTDYIADSDIQEHEVTLKFNNEKYYFVVSAVRVNKDNEIMLTFHNITDLKEKEKLLFEQSKLAAMGEMIGNIAHQWRQPLSVISTGVTGLQMKQEFGILDSESLTQTCESINNNVQYLSKTIDDFRDFIKGDTTKVLFSIKDIINSFQNLMEASIRNHHINFIIDIEQDIMINGYKNELTQCLINIFNNAKDILNERKISYKLIFLTVNILNDNQIQIIIKDNAGGISQDILPKIFEPYFTTKHQSQGTGLGLHMTYNLITASMEGTITATNTIYKYNDIEYKGAQFTIILPTK